MLYSSTDILENDAQTIDANSYPPFRIVDSNVVGHIIDEVEALGEPEEEGQPMKFPSCHLSALKYILAPCALVGAVTKALCCESHCKS
jgi:transcription initiation factor TFIIH subunit 3